MPGKSRLSPRKPPLQPRSQQTKEDILNGAIRVLTAYGPTRMLGDTRLAPHARVATMVEMFFQGESKESPSLLGLIEDAQAHFRDSRECRQLRREADARAAHHAPAADRARRACV